MEYLLTTNFAYELYNSTAKKLPIIDFHNHLTPEDITGNKVYSNIFELWLECDPYKHRAMRICGVEEKYITGNMPAYEKFHKWCSIFPRLIGNPVYEWSKSELKNIFGIDDEINERNCALIWDRTNEMLKTEEYSLKGILQKFNVEYAAPCMSLTDIPIVLENQTRIVPSVRGDNLLLPDHSTITELEMQTGIRIISINDYMNAVDKRIRIFDEAGCRLSDHALDDGFVFIKNDNKNDDRFLRLTDGSASQEDKVRLSSYILQSLAMLYGKLGWAMQLHIGAVRSTSSRLRRIAGPAGGYAAIGKCDINSLINLLNAVEENGVLPTTILYTMNIAEQAAFAVLSGSFSGENGMSKVQLGPAWWWCDNLYGIRNSLEVISNLGILSQFIGMTTDSRSILSFQRHDYFRRALCGWIGEKVKVGVFPNKSAAAEDLIRKICCQNAKKMVIGNC